jgi:gamma-glutamyl hercynylcysteine S-oxide synthase
MSEALQLAAGLRERVVAELEAARAGTLAVLETIPDEELVRQHSPLMSPLVWDLAHIGHFEELWLLRRLTGAAPLHPETDEMYDAFEHVRSARVDLPLLEPPATRAYLAEVRARALEALDQVELDPDDRLLCDGFVYGVVAQHERQHVETMLQTIQLSGLEHEGGGPRSLATVGYRDVLVGKGPFTMGTDDEPWAYDNERPAHDRELPAFRIDTQPVSNASYCAFLEAGGWDEPPLFWQRDGNDWLHRCFGRLEPVPPDEPVQHVSFAEAEAYARWAGKRLPAEAEWEKAAKLGVLEGIGSVWEWTSSDFQGYPGFEAFPYREYSEVFFGDEYKVLRGSSWATHPLVARTTVRNWDYPIRRQIFAGFRCAEDA